MTLKGSALYFPAFFPHARARYKEANSFGQKSSVSEWSMQLPWKQLNTLYITSDLLWILFSLSVHSSQYSHPLTTSTTVLNGLFLYCTMYIIRSKLSPIFNGRKVITFLKLSTSNTKY